MFKKRWPRGRQRWRRWRLSPTLDISLMARCTKSQELFGPFPTILKMETPRLACHRESNVKGNSKCGEAEMKTTFIHNIKQKISECTYL